METGDHLGIYAVNCPEWVIAEQACYTQGIVPISLYDTLGPDAVGYILKEAGVKVIVATKDKIPALLQAAKDCPDLKLIIQIEKEGEKAIQEQAQEQGIKLISFSEVEDNGAFYSREANPSNSGDLATIMYTSGTTGNPKGVMITHSNLISMIAGKLFELFNSRFQLFNHSSCCLLNSLILIFLCRSPLTLPSYSILNYISYLSSYLIHPISLTFSLLFLSSLSCISFISSSLISIPSLPSLPSLLSLSYLSSFVSRLFCSSASIFNCCSLSSLFPFISHLFSLSLSLLSSHLSSLSSLSSLFSLVSRLSSLLLFDPFWIVTLYS